MLFFRNVRRAPLCGDRGAYPHTSEATPLIRKLTRGRFELGDYQAFLVNLRQQVKDGALRMSRAASNIGEGHLELRSTLMRHAVTEHRDFRMLEADYVASGGERRFRRIAGQPFCIPSKRWLLPICWRYTWLFSFAKQLGCSSKSN
jgi:hypothetical protein